MVITTEDMCYWCFKLEGMPEDKSIHISIHYFFTINNFSPSSGPPPPPLVHVWMRFTSPLFPLCLSLYPSHFHSCKCDINNLRHIYHKQCMYTSTSSMMITSHPHAFSHVYSLAHRIQHGSQLTWSSYCCFDVIEQWVEDPMAGGQLFLW